MAALIRYLVIFVFASAAGVYSATNLSSGYYDLVSRSVGVWKTWPNAGTRDTDPYTRAHFISAHRFPLSRFEILEFEAHVDGDGANIDAGCRYRIAGPIPTARRWSLVAVQADSKADAAVSPNNSITSSIAVADSSGSVEVILSQTPAPGNWLQPQGSGNQLLLLRLLDPVFGAGRDSLERQPFSIEKVTC